MNLPCTPKLNSNNPLVSIIIPIHNVGKYIAQTIDSLCAQSYSNLEILIIDDNSDDNSLEIAHSFAKIDRRISVLRNTHRSGVSGTRNTGIDIFQGEWLAFLDGDDVLHVDSIRLRVESALRHVDTPFFSGDFYRFYDHIEDCFGLQSESDPFWKKYLKENTGVLGEALINQPLEKFLLRHLTWTGSAFLRRDLVRRIGGFDETLPRSEDVLFWLLAAAHSSTFVFVSNSISYYRQRPGSLSTTSLAPDEYAVLAFRKLKLNSKFSLFHRQLDQCIIDHINKNTYYYRKNLMRMNALRSAFSGVTSFPICRIAWKNLLGSLIGR